MIMGKKTVILQIRDNVHSSSCAGFGFLAFGGGSTPTSSSPFTFSF